MTEIYDNVVHDNGQYGIYGSQSVVVRNNVVDGHIDTNDVGIRVDSGAQAVENEVYGNWAGLYVYSTAEARNNRVYANTDRGIYVTYYDGTVVGNTVYSNPTGIYVGVYDGGAAQITNNLIYGNSLWGSYLNDGYNHAVKNNTVYQPAGGGIALRSSLRNAQIQNNVLWVENGLAIDVANDSQTWFSSDYNLFSLGGAGRVGIWE